ncbi:DNA polymerase III subunit gamma and tau [Mobilicoccus pelagius]|uniref:DNA-directed DNA polymerase n=1 Tax=Mobilicoccus pelagius NBRC 104925 TaxID=1089455 RepID=H5UQX8_9MICO|nr:DNA polymerase III subunit gamma and tau [Mobilicoccus pelagius]GAB48136.1 hypothetical protein MOPEL_060_00530 [Mobilicoccus pelagius NBRC 104925]
MTTALYRRYRPQDFSEVIGQEHVTEPLMQALRSGRVGHAYLFSGPRGCGKTTSARILARCLNCEQGPTPTPCGECDSCRALATGGPGSVDVIEIDAASHGGVDDARDLREKAAYGPAQSRFKVYIIDEAHMVTPQGFNALLKIVEEPPEHVKFVFATTEPEKVIGTIRSRTHHYPFRLVPPARLQEYLEELCAREGVAVEPGVLSFVVRAGGGSVRDSLSVLDQLMAGSGEAGLTYGGAAALLGFTEGELLDATVDAIAAGDGAGVFRQIDRVIETGQDPRRFVEDLLERFRDLIVLAAVSQATDADPQTSAVLRGLPQDQITRMRQQAGAFGPGQLSYAADVVNAGLTEMTGATSPRLQLELLCARLLLPTGAGEHGYAARLDRLERRLDVGSGIAAPIPPQGPPPAVPVAETVSGEASARARPVAPADRGDATSDRPARHGEAEDEVRRGSGAPAGWRDQRGRGRPQGGAPSATPAERPDEEGRSQATAPETPRGVAEGGPTDGRGAGEGTAPTAHPAGPDRIDTAPGTDHGAAPADRRPERPEPDAGHTPGEAGAAGRPADHGADDRATPGRASEPAPAGRADSGRLEGGRARPGQPTAGAAAQSKESRPAGPRGAVDTDMIRRNWPDVLQRIFGIRRVTWTFLSEHAQVLDYDGSRLLLGLSTPGLATTFRNGPHSEVVRQALSEALGIDTRVEGIPASDGPSVLARGRGAAPGPAGGGVRPAPDDRAARGRPRGGVADAAPRPDHGATSGATDRHPTDRHQGRRPRGDGDGDDSDRPDRAGRGGRPGRPAAPAWDDDRPPPGDDDAPPPEESYPPDPVVEGLPHHEAGHGVGRGQVGGRPPFAGGRGGAGHEAVRPGGGAVEATGDEPADRPAPGGRPEVGRDEHRPDDHGSDEHAHGDHRHVHPGAAQAREALRAARGRHGHRADAPGAAPSDPRRVDDDISVDDEDIADASAVGQPVIAAVLGGIVIAEEEG